MRLLSLVALDSGPWRHPWKTRAQWNGHGGRWEAMVMPGLLNGLDPIVRLDGQDVPLASRPAIPLPGYRTPSPVPDYFLARGVLPPATVDSGGELLSIAQDGLLEDAAQARQLRACDLVLGVDRPLMRTEWTTGAGVDGTFAQFSVTITTAPNHNTRARVVAKTEFVPPVIAARQDLLAGNVATDAQDQVLIATVFLLSPRGAAPDAAPDEAWSAHVRHHVFWNLHHGMRQMEPPLAKQTLTLNTGLAGGVGDAFNNFLLAQINDPLSAASEFLGREGLETRFWTA